MNMTTYIIIHSICLLDPTLSLNNNDNITVLRGNVITFECIPSNLAFPVRWIFYSQDGSTIRISTTDVMFDDGQTLSFEIEPAGLFHRLTINNIPLTATGIFSCEIAPSCRDSIVVAQNTSLSVQPG